MKCVRHRDGWCVVHPSLRNIPPRELAERDNVETLCGMVVILPGGVEHRRPTCEECKAALRKEVK